MLYILCKEYECINHIAYSNWGNNTAILFHFGVVGETYNFVNVFFISSTIMILNLLPTLSSGLERSERIFSLLRQLWSPMVWLSLFRNSHAKLINFMRKFELSFENLSSRSCELTALRFRIDLLTFSTTVSDATISDIIYAQNSRHLNIFLHYSDLNRTERNGRCNKITPVTN